MKDIFYDYENRRQRNDFRRKCAQCDQKRKTPTLLYVPDPPEETGSQPSEKPTYARAFTLSKIDVATGKRLAGAVYELARQPAGPVASETTGENGTIRFTLRSGGSYTIRETAAPEGYRLDPKIHTVEVGPRGTVRINGTFINRLLIPSVRDEADTPRAAGRVRPPGLPAPALAAQSGGALRFLACDSLTRAPLEGCAFLLSGGALSRTAVTGKDGFADFSVVPEGAYSLQQTTPPAGYEPSDKVYAVQSRGDGTVAVDFKPSTAFRFECARRP